MATDRGDRQRDGALTLLEVPWFSVPNYWPDCGPWIAKALEGRSVTHSADDLYAACLSRDMTLWLALRADGKPVAGAVSRVDQYPRAKVCTMIAIGGGGMEGWLQFEQLIGEWAKAQGCEYIEGSGRRGWARAAVNYQPVYVVYRRKL